MARLPAPGPVVIPNCGQVRLLWTQNSVNWSVVLHGNLTAAGPLNPGIAESIFSAIKAAAGTTTWLGMVHPSASFIGVQVKDLRAPNNPTILSSGAAAPGTAAGVPVSQGTAMCITLNTAFAGKGFRGRAYLGGLAEATLADARHFTGPAQTAGVGFIQAVQTATTAQGLPLVVAQRALQAGTTSSGAQLPARPAGVVPVTQIVTVGTRIDSQRKRLGH